MIFPPKPSPSPTTRFNILALRPGSSRSLLRGVPMGERTLHPLELKTEGETLTFTVELCVPLPQTEKPGMEPPGRMATLNLDI